MSGAPARPFDRRAASKAISRLAAASVAEILAGTRPEPTCSGGVIGVTGPPGAGKSTLIGRLAALRLEQVAPVAILAIDPTSPYSQGSILGDRIRMDRLSEDPRVFIRSLPSRASDDGLTDNLCEMLDALAEFGFRETFVETVGVGQSAYGVRVLADVEVLVLTPGAGDYVQAMKAGIMETADIFVVNKAELPGTDRLVQDILGLPRRGRIGEPPVIRVRVDQADGVEALSRAIDGFAAAGVAAAERARVRRRRRQYQVQRLVQRAVHAAVAASPEPLWEAPLPEIYDRLVAQLGQPAADPAPPAAPGPSRLGER